MNEMGIVLAKSALSYILGITATLALLIVAAILTGTVYMLGVRFLTDGFEQVRRRLRRRFNTPLVTRSDRGGPITVPATNPPAAGVAWFLYSSRGGLALRAVGDNHESAHALGYNVVAIRYLATLFGGACAGLGGAYLSVVDTPMWGENMTAGRGWIALALVVFATWRPGRLVAGAYLFAAVSILPFYAQAVDTFLCGRAPLLCFGDSEDKLLTLLPSQFLAMAPYLATILALVIISRDVNLTKANAPACIGRPFRAER